MGLEKYVMLLQYFNLYEDDNAKNAKKLKSLFTFDKDDINTSKRGYVIVSYNVTNNNAGQASFIFDLVEIPTMRYISGVSIDLLADCNVPLYNFIIKRDKNKKIQVIPLRGTADRYKANAGNVFAYTTKMTILAEVYFPKAPVKIVQDGKAVTKYVEQYFYFVINAYGRIGYLSQAQVIELGVRYTMTNARLYTKELIALDTQHTGDLFLPRISEEYYKAIKTASRMVDTNSQTAYKYVADLEAEQQRAEQRKADKSVKFDEQYITSVIVPINSITLSNDQLKKLRALYDTINELTNEEIRVLMRDIPQYHDPVLVRSLVSSTYTKAMMYGYADKVDMQFCEYMYNNLVVTQDKLYSIANILDKSTDPTVKVGFNVVLEGITKPTAQVYNAKVFRDIMANPDMSNVYLRALRAESQITNNISNLVGQLGGEFEGKHHRLKSPASYFEKANERAILEGKDTKTAVDGMKDIIRYTIIFRGEPDFDEYTVKAYRLLCIYAKDTTGTYSCLSIKNFWQKFDNPYNGINTAYCYKLSDKVSDTTNFEVQVHTRSSYDAKMGEMHKLYEEWRDPTTSQERRDALTVEMQEISKSVYRPKDIDNLETTEDGTKVCLNTTN